MRLPIQTRLAGLLALVLLALLGAIALLDRAQHEQVRRLYAERIEQSGSVFDRLVLLKEHGFEVHAGDYSRWDEFVDFVRRPDAEWARINLDESLEEFGLDLAWVLDDTGRTLYVTEAGRRTPLSVPPGVGEDLTRRLRRSPFLHYFAPAPGGLLEVWTAPVQPSADLDRSTHPAGYYVIARHWTPQVLEDLSKVADGRVVLEDRASARSAAAPARAGRIVIERDLTGLDGAPVARLRFETDFPLARELGARSRRSVAYLIAVALVLVVVTYALLARWVARPMRALQVALHHNDPGLLGNLPERDDEFGRLAGLVVESVSQRETIVREVRERRLAEQDAALSRDFVRQVMDTDPNVIHVVDAQHRLVLANAAAARLLGIAPEVATGCDVGALLEPLGGRASFAAGCRRAVETWAPQEAEEELALPGGERRRFQSVRCPLRRTEGETHILTISVDVTERARHERELEQAKEAAEAGTRAKSRFLANASHELRTPLHGILSYARFGIRECDTEERAPLRDYFQNVHDCGDGLLQMLNDLLDLARIESGRMAFEVEDVPIDEVLDSAAVEFESLMHERGVRLSVADTSGLPAVRADRVRLLQVMRNLLANASRFTPAGGAVEVSAECDDIWVRVRVRDEGVGIPAGELERVFEPFIQSSTTRTAQGGTGLGLAICREILEALGGRIWAERDAVRGASFVFEVPRADAAAVREPRSAGPEPESLAA